MHHTRLLLYSTVIDCKVYVHATEVQTKVFDFNQCHIWSKANMISFQANSQLGTAK